MQIYDTLKKDHDTLKQLLTQLNALGENADPQDLIGKIRDALVPHSRAEEAVFYNSLREFEEAKDKVRHSYSEHMMAESLLRTLQVKGKVGGDWHKTAQELTQAIQDHVQEEEGPIFAVARQHFTKEEAQMMSEAFRMLKSESKEQGFLKNSLDLVANMMPPRFTERFRKFNVADWEEKKKAG